MSDIDQGAASIDQMILGTVVAQIRGDIDIGYLRRRAEEGVPRASTDGDGANCRCEIACNPHPVRGCWQRTCHKRAEGLEGQRSSQRADTPRPESRVTSIGHERSQVAEPKCLGEGIADTGARVIGIRVCAEECDSVLDATGDDFALGMGCGNLVNPMQEERMVSDDELSSAGNRFIDDLRQRVNRKENGVDLSLEAPAGKPHGIPVLGQPLRIRRIQGGDELADGSHG